MTVRFIFVDDFLSQRDIQTNKTLIQSRSPEYKRHTVEHAMHWPNRSVAGKICSKLLS